MGNSSSSTSTNNSKDKFDNFYDVMDYIATYYILTMDFKSLSKLSEKDYCDNLVVLTSDIIKRYFTDMEIEYLAQRVKNGVEVNEMTKDNIVYINKNQLESLDVSNDAQKSIKKKRVCIGIAKFYVKIAHIFSAIVMTINPIYTYKDPYGRIVKTKFMDKDTIPKNTKRKLYKMNICDNRIRALKKTVNTNTPNTNSPNTNTPNTNKDDITIQPKICDINTNINGQIKNLSEEPGIMELVNLYLDDNYDYSTGTFTGMSKTTEAQYKNDLKTFYTAFTGNDTMPPEIQKFSDIKLRDYNIIKNCQGQDAVFKKSYTINKNDELFVNYANNITKMIQRAAINQSKLLSVINVLFTYVIDPYTKKKKIRVNPNLTDELLQNAIVNTRKFIIDLYVKCETDYVTGVKLYEAIVESKILETTQKQINQLKKESTKIVSDINNTKKPVNTENDLNNNLEKVPTINSQTSNLPTTFPNTYATPVSLNNPIVISQPIAVSPLRPIVPVQSNIPSSPPQQNEEF